MQINLLETSKSYLKNSLLNKASNFLDEKTDSLKKAIHYILPILISGIVEKNEQHNGDLEIYNLIKYSSFKTIKKFDEIFEGNNSLVFDESYNILKKIFGNKYSIANDLITQNIDLHKDSSNSLLKMLLSVVIHVTGNKIEEHNISYNEFSNMLNTQKDFIAQSVSEAFMNDMVSQLGLFSFDDKSGLRKTSTKKSTPLKPILLSAIAALVIISVLYYTNRTKLKKIHLKEVKTELKDDVLKNTLLDKSLFFTPSSQTIGKFIKNKEVLGKFVKRKVGNDTFIILDKGGFNNFINFIQSDKPYGKTDWFTLNRILVDKANSAIDFTKSESQINDLVKLMDIYPNISIKIGCNLDNQGPALENFNISHKIAEVVIGELIKKGVSAERLRFEGYGENYPVASNDTEEGRRRNRKIIVRLTQK